MIAITRESKTSASGNTIVNVDGKFTICIGAIFHGEANRKVSGPRRPRDHYYIGCRSIKRLTVAAECRRIIAAERRRMGKSATESQWSDLLESQVALAKKNRTARDVLRTKAGRDAIAVASGRPGQYTSATHYLCTRAVAKDAILIYQARQNRRHDREIADLARNPGIGGRITRLAPVYRAKRIEAARPRWLKRLAAGKLGRGGVERGLTEYRDSVIESVSTAADHFARAVAQAVGTIGEQAARDLREMKTSEDFSGKRGKHHKLTKTTITRVEHVRDWSACLLTMRDYSSFGSGGSGQYNSRGGSAFRCYLLVRCPSTGKCHILRVAPKFGNNGTQFFSKFKTSNERIHAARASTFDRQPHEFAPGVES